MAYADVYSVSSCHRALWLRKLHVWLARPRKSNHARARAPQVSLPLHQRYNVVDGRCSLLAVQDRNHWRAFVVASVAGIYSLFPLLFQPAGEYRLRGGRVEVDL